jgi:hypothetical protein
MKQVAKIMAVVLILATMTAGTLPGQGKGRGNNGTGGRPGTVYSLAEYPAGEISEAEKAGLLLMYEEEKLARDVYNTLYEKRGLPIFENIALSEQTHIDAVKQLLERYGLDTDIQEPGEFTNSELSALFSKLTRKGAENIESALSVGVTIEDLDIDDLRRLIRETDNEDIKVVYNNLQKGSRNHLRSFNSQLEKYGVVYDATYITSEYLEKIISTEKEKGGITDPYFVF